MSRSAERISIFVGGAVVGAVALLLYSRSDNSPAVIDQAFPTEETAEAQPKSHEMETAAEPQYADLQTAADNKQVKKLSAEVGDLPEVYKQNINPPKRILEFSDYHSLFEREQRDEPWAAAMESGIHHSISNAGAGDWSVVEYVECRSRICILAGYTHDDRHPMPLIEQFVDSGAWPDVLHGTVVTRFPDRSMPDIDRFMILVSGYGDEEVRSLTSPQ